MFGLDLTELVLQKTHVRSVDGAQKYAVSIVDVHGAAHDFQLPKLSRHVYALLVKEWGLRELVTSKFSAANDKCIDPSKTALEVFIEGEVAKAKAQFDKSVMGRAKSEVQRRIDTIKRYQAKGRA